MATLEQRYEQEGGEAGWLGRSWTSVTTSVERDSSGSEHMIRRQRFNGGLIEEFDGEAWVYPERNVFGNPFP